MFPFNFRLPRMIYVFFLWQGISAITAFSVSSFLLPVVFSLLPRCGSFDRVCVDHKTTTKGILYDCVKTNGVCFLHQFNGPTGAMGWPKTVHTPVTKEMMVFVVDWCMHRYVEIIDALVYIIWRPLDRLPALRCQG